MNDSKKSKCKNETIKRGIKSIFIKLFQCDWRLTDMCQNARHAQSATHCALFYLLRIDKSFKYIL